MSIEQILKYSKIETSGASTERVLALVGLLLLIKDIVFAIKVHEVKNLGTTQVGLVMKHGPDEDEQFMATHSTPISATTITATPVLLVGWTDSDTNGPLLKHGQPAVTVGGGAGEWAKVEVFAFQKEYF